MAYPFLNASQPINYTGKQEYTNQFQETLTDQFYNASDWYTIQEESSLASGVYRNIDVRINDVIDAKVGDKLVDDDVKLLLFSDINHNVDLGLMYQFNSNFWVTSNVDKIKSLVSTATVKRCNNMLRWQTPDGAIYEFPASLNFIIKQNRDYSTAGSAVVTPAGTLRLITQFNSVTNKIKANQRFLFGNADNWIAYRVEGGGIENYNNLQTINNTSAGIISFTMVVDYVNEQTDNLTDGIADYQGTYLLTLDQHDISGDNSQTVQLNATVTLNGDVVTRDVTWISNDEMVATVDSNGLVTFIAEGTTSIQCNLLNNSEIFDVCDVEVTGSPVDNYIVSFSPSTNFILDGDELVWTAYLFKNNIQQSDVIAFTLDPNDVPSSKYIYTVTGDNEFKIHNYGMFLTSNLEVTATVGIYSSILSISLRGAW